MDKPEGKDQKQKVFLKSKLSHKGLVMCLRSDNASHATPQTIQESENCVVNTFRSYMIADMSSPKSSKNRQQHKKQNTLGINAKYYIWR